MCSQALVTYEPVHSLCSGAAGPQASESSAPHEDEEDCRAHGESEGGVAVWLAAHQPKSELPSSPPRIVNAEATYMGSRGTESP